MPGRHSKTRTKPEAAATEAVAAPPQVKEAPEHGLLSLFGLELFSTREVLTVWGLLGTLLALSYVLRSSAVRLVSPVPDVYWAYLVYGALIFCAGCLFLGGFKVRGFMFLPMLGTLLGSLNAPLPRDSLLKWLGWCMLIFTVGPVLQTYGAVRFRESAWRFTRLCLLIVALGSAVWFLAGLPVLGKGLFTGLTVHANITGPLSAMAVMITLIAALRHRSFVWGAASVLCLIPTIAAASRAGILGLAAALVMVGLYNLRAMKLALVMMALLFGGWMFVESDMMDLPMMESMTTWLKQKGLENTRQHLWEARLYEFQQHPVIGLGVGMAQNAGSAYLSEDRMNVEPGSSYLATLSMTGIVGTSSIIFSLWLLGKSVRWKFREIPAQQLDELLAVLVILGVDALAEGWFLAIGSFFTFIFWLACGRAVDLTPAQPLEIAETSNRSRRRKKPLREHTSTIQPVSAE